MKRFEIISDISDIQAIATGSRVRIREYLNETYGRGRWRKMKGFATIRYRDGTIEEVEIHWYEAHGIGRKDLKIKRSPW
ncbi:MAG: hypothetical protein HYV26_03000 [Candidatus Hydrogenedentes bacterium]|nr:hypothetical protein [Candidatus Hydrogenedentota bacterium]MBI3117922.1 hypothetical protein [Candidatus Hydrogenedentota bacterium]